MSCHLTIYLWLCQANIFINELHYYNQGQDVGQFVELAYETGENVVGLYYLELYNGNTGRTYGSRWVVGAQSNVGVADTRGGLSFVYFEIPSLRNSQSGEGIALIDGRNDAVVEFISYDGTFIARDGVAAGMQSVDIGVSERDGSGGIALSVQLGGVGCDRADFVWQSSSLATKGSLNNDQSGACNSQAPTISDPPSTQPSVSPTNIASQNPSQSPSIRPVSRSTGMNLYLCDVPKY